MSAVLIRSIVRQLMLVALLIPPLSDAASPVAVRPSPTPTPDLAAQPMPPLLLCDGTEGLSRLSLKEGGPAVLWPGGEVRDVQPQGDGSYLVTGGSGIVTCLRRDGRGDVRVLWDWSEMNLPCLVNAVAAERGWKGEPALVLASDCTLNRLLLAEARSRAPKIRWEFKLPAAPQRVSLCPDTGNFLVTMRVRTEGMGAPPQVAEIDYRQDRVGWSLDDKNGIVAAQDAVRTPSGHTLVVAGCRAALYCFDKAKNLLWESPLAPTADASHTLFLARVGGKPLLWVCARPKAPVPAAGKRSSRPRRPTGCYLVDPERGRVLAFRRELREGPAPWNVVPEDASYLRGR
jgi:hypothetical protein